MFCSVNTLSFTRFGLTAKEAVMKDWNENQLLYY